MHYVTVLEDLEPVCRAGVRDINARLNVWPQLLPLQAKAMSTDKGNKICKLTGVPSIIGGVFGSSDQEEVLLRYLECWELPIGQCKKATICSQVSATLPGHNAVDSCL